MCLWLLFMTLQIIFFLRLLLASSYRCGWCSNNCWSWLIFQFIIVVSLWLSESSNNSFMHTLTSETVIRQNCLFWILGINACINARFTICWSPNLVWNKIHKWALEFVNGYWPTPSLVHSAKFIQKILLTTWKNSLEKMPDTFCRHNLLAISRHNLVSTFTLVKFS